MGGLGVLREGGWDRFGGKSGGKVGVREVAQRIRQGGQGSQTARRETVDVGQGRGKRRSTQTGRERKSWESPGRQRWGLSERPPRGLCPATAGVAVTEDTEEGQGPLALHLLVGHFLHPHVT